MSAMISVRMIINGQPYGPVSIPETLSMVELLHEYFDLPGTRYGCGVAQCRACTVIIDNADGTSEASVTCVMPASTFDGKTIRTIEGHAKRNTQGQLVLSPIQQAFLDGFSFQCGYCTPGFVNRSTVALETLKKNPIAKERVEAFVLEALNDHICRCTGYVDYAVALRDLILKTDGLTLK